MTSEGKKICPSCGGKDTRHSVRGGLLDAFMQMFRKRPFRCRSCRRRFYSYEIEPESAEVVATEKTTDEAADRKG